jgi:transcriptional regulator with XRE-family HTH domain
MSIKLDDFLGELPAEERAAIQERGAELITEEAGLRDLREARRQSQVQIAARLGINQAAVSKMERRTDMYISTLRDLVRAMGGELEIVARFPDHPTVRITQFKALKGEILSSR